MHRSAKLLAGLTSVAVSATAACAAANRTSDPSSTAFDSGDVMPPVGTRDRDAGGGGADVGAAAAPWKKGLGAEQVREVVLAHVPQVRACYEAEAQRTPSLKGGVSIRWRVEMNGAVSSASIAKTTLAHPGVEDCIVNEVRSWTFPASDAPTVVQSFPFKFGTGG